MFIPCYNVILCIFSIINIFYLLISKYKYGNNFFFNGSGYMHSKHLLFALHFGVNSSPLQNLKIPWSALVVHTNKFGVHKVCTPKCTFSSSSLECTAVHSNIHGVHTLHTPKFWSEQVSHTHFLEIFGVSGVHNIIPPNSTQCTTSSRQVIPKIPIHSIHLYTFDLFSSSMDWFGC